MPTFAQLKTRVSGYLIDNPAFTTALVGDWLNKAIDDAEGRHNYSHMERTLTGVTALDTRLVDTRPADWKMARAAPFYLRNDGSTREMSWGITGQMMRRQFAEGDPDEDGDPKFLLEDGDNLTVYPYPDGGSDYTDKEYRIHVPYWGVTPALTGANGTNWWTDNWHWYLTFYAAAEGFLVNRDTTEATIYIERAEAERQKSVRRSKQQQTKPVRMLVPRRDVFGTGRQPPRG